LDQKLTEVKVKLAGKVAIVTGAGRGIGRGIALELAKAGARVIVNYLRSEQMAHEVVKQIRELKQDALSIKADVSKINEVNHMVNETVDSFGGLDILVNNTGITIVSSFLECTEDIWERTIDVNLKGVFLCSQAAAKIMMKRGGGKIVNISSVHGHSTIRGVAHYAASKGGVNMLTKAMALDLAPYKINVNCIAPGTIEVEKMLDEPTYDRDAWKDGAPWGRVGFPSEIGKVAVFFASDDADYITGQILYVDGGITARSGWQIPEISKTSLP
jgi:NAD(P)-dependent dehydrogenase (short-subunit alcohol dehydrogenase family)